MKKFISNIIAASMVCAGLGLSAGCNYLDVDPELGITEDEVFSTTTNALTFISRVFNANNGKNKCTMTLTNPMYVDLCNNAFCQWVAFTDAADCGRLTVAQRNFKACNLNQTVINYYTFSTVQADKPIADAMFQVIRVANKAIDGFDRIKSGREEEKENILGLAYYVRGYAHFILARTFGPMPYIDHVIGADDEWDIERGTLLDTYLKAAKDLEIAYEHFVKAEEVTETGTRYMRRNSVESLIGATNDENFAQKQPSGCSCLAFRARMLLYAASPLANTDNNPEIWKMAADAAALAIEKAVEWGYELLPFESITDNYYGKKMTNEAIHGYFLAQKNNVQNWAGSFSYCQSGYTGIKGTSGTHPTQNFVDRFETIDGYNLYDVDYEKGEQIRAKAAADGHYNPQNPYANRDPRLDKVIVHDGSAFPIKATGDGTFNIYYDPTTDTYPTTTINGKVMKYAGPWGSTDLDVQALSNTGYYSQRHWDGSFDQSSTHFEPQIRLGELYLNFAEAMNEYYGPTATNPDYPEITNPDGSTISNAVEAVNLIRARAGMPGVRQEYVDAGKDVMRERIQNERCVELAFECNHYYFDIRRWKIAPKTMKQTLYGMEVEKVPASADYPIGRKFTRKPIPANRQQTWKDCMYFFPFPDAEANKMKNFVNNAAWK